MKVLHVINSLDTGGAEKLLVDSLQRYRDKGLEVDLLLLNATDSLFLNDMYKSFKGRVFSLQEKPSIKSIYNPLLALKLKSYMKAYDVFHVHLFPSLYYLAFAKWLFNRKAILCFTEHSTYNRRLANVFFRLLDRIIYSAYNAVVAISDEVRSTLINQLNLSEDKIVTIYNAIDLDKFQNSKPYRKVDFGFNETDFLLVQTARFYEPKDQPTVVRALCHLENDVKLIFIGDGPLKTAVEQLSIDLKVSDRVSFLGVRSDVAEVTKMCDVAIVSSNWEGFGLAPIEAMACAKPVIFSNISGLKDVVGKAGIPFSKGNEKELAKMIRSLAADKSLYDSRCAASSEKSMSYSINGLIDKTILLYKKLCQ